MSEFIDTMKKLRDICEDRDFCTDCPIKSGGVCKTLLYKMSDGDLKELEVIANEYRDKKENKEKAESLTNAVRVIRDYCNGMTMCKNCMLLIFDDVMGYKCMLRYIPSTWEDVEHLKDQGQ